MPGQTTLKTVGENIEDVVKRSLIVVDVDRIARGRVVVDVDVELEDAVGEPGALGESELLAGTVDVLVVV